MKPYSLGIHSHTCRLNHSLEIKGFRIRYISIIVLLLSYTFQSCENLVDGEPQISTLNDQLIETRDGGECDLCTTQNYCCCYFELVPGNPLGNYEFEICGVPVMTYNDITCSLSTGHSACYTFSNYGQNFTLNPGGQTREWFCLSPNSAFAIQYLNASGNVYGRVTCSSNGIFQIPISMLFTPYTSGSGYYLYYFLLNECEVESPCNI